MEKFIQVALVHSEMPTLLPLTNRITSQFYRM